MEELLDLLDEMGVGELGQLLRIENDELKALRAQAHAHEQALIEAKQHLANAMTDEALTTLSNKTEKGLGLTNQEDLSARAKDVAQTVSGLRLTVAEQRADIDDLEAALCESRATARDLRKRLRVHELRQFTAASQCAGVGDSEGGLMDRHCAPGGMGSAVWSVGASDSSSLAVIPTREEEEEQQPSVIESCASDEHSGAAAATASTRSTRVDAQGVYLHHKHQMSAVTASHSSGFSSAARLRSFVANGPRRLCSSLAARFRRPRANPSASLFNL
ncbi:hypothetical protein GGI23_000973 [Coemansia sp. RSA 2559]|nr:hypothetical protein GGI23_000973 [Coemansia sp. RSA 2559]